MIVKVMKIESGSVTALAAALGISYLLGLVISCIQVAHGTGHYVPMGTGLAVVISLIFQAALTLSLFARSFNLAVSMGRTRREIIGGYWFLAMAELLALFISFWILYGIECLLAAAIFPKLTMLGGINVLLQPKILLPVLAGIWCLEFFIGAVTMKFGAKAWWTIWAVWMASCFGIPDLIGRGLKGMLPAGLSAVGRFFAEGGPKLWIACGAAVMAALVIVAWRMLKKQQVTA